MRLTNRTKTWAEASRRFWGERKETPAEGLRDAERSALMEPVDSFSAPAREPEPAPSEPSPEMVSLLSGDPTQQLLTALGRFQRQVIVADSGAPAEAWVDNCIDQLISGIQIAHVRGWKGVKEALTDTARVLQSYDEGGDASGCVAFLQDAYEILCLMVGDLIVDNVRSGVMDKWRERYARAVAELEQSGHSLIDEDTGVAPPPVRVTMPVSSGMPTNVTPFVPRAVTTDIPGDEAPEALHDAYSEVNIPDVTYGDEAFADEETAYVDERGYGVDPEPEPEVSPFSSSLEESAWEEEEPEELTYESEEMIAEVDEEPAVIYVEEVEELEEQAEAATLNDAAFDVEETSPFDAPEDQEAPLEAVVAFEPGEAVLEKDEALELNGEADAPADMIAAEALVEVEEEVESWLVLPEADTVEDDALPVEDAEAETPESEPVATGEFLFDELAENASSEALVDVTYIDEGAEEESLDAVADLFTTPEMPEAETVEAVEEASSVEEIEQPQTAPKATEDTPEALLRHAQAAMMRGDVRDAKVLALQLAANMAKLEAQKAVQIVQDAITRLSETEHAIEVADTDVSRAEARLQDTSRIREEREHEIDLKKSGIHGLEKRVDSVESAIEKIEEQIAKLRAQHEIELEKLAEAQADLEVEREEERMLLEDLDRIHETEQAASDTLELARTRAEQLRQQRLEREQAREACEQMLARQRESAEGIDRTLEAVMVKHS